MSIRERQLPSGITVYEVRYRDGDRHRSRSFRDRGAARRFDDQLAEVRRNGEFEWEMRRRRLTLQHLVEDWWERRAGSVSQSTRESYARHFDKRILPAFGRRKAATLRPGDIERWMQGMRDEGAGEPTVAHAVAALQAVLTLAVQDGVLLANPVAAVRKPVVERARSPVLIRPLIVERMARDLRDRDRARDAVLVELLAYAGLRPESEAVTLTWGQVRERTIVVTSRKGRQARPKERSVPLFPPLARTLAEWRASSGYPSAGRLVVPAAGAKGWTHDAWQNWQTRVFKPVAWWAYLPEDVRPRDLRGSLASLLIHEGRSVVDVARIMGHGPEVCLKTYAQVWADFDPARRVSAVDVMEAARRDVRMEYARWRRGNG